jgi:hypothetical protein
MTGSVASGVFAQVFTKDANLQEEDGLAHEEREREDRGSALEGPCRARRH